MYKCININHTKAKAILILTLLIFEKKELQKIKIAKNIYCKLLTVFF